MNLQIKYNEHKKKKNVNNKPNLNRMSSESGEVLLKSSTNGNGYGERSDGEIASNGNGQKLNKFFSGDYSLKLFKSCRF
jgi:hypothetical protein